MPGHLLATLTYAIVPFGEYRGGFAGTRRNDEPNVSAPTGPRVFAAPSRDRGVWL
jgi:hypothetical protein